jgi:hypothetical protein
MARWLTSVIDQDSMDYSFVLMLPYKVSWMVVDLHRVGWMLHKTDQWSSNTSSNKKRCK